MPRYTAPPLRGCARCILGPTTLWGNPCTARALLLDYVPPEEPLGTPLGNTLRIRRPKLHWRGP